MRIVSLYYLFYNGHQTPLILWLFSGTFNLQIAGLHSRLSYRIEQTYLISADVLECVTLWKDQT